MTHAYSCRIIAYVVTRPVEIRHAATDKPIGAIAGARTPHANSCGVCGLWAIQGLMANPFNLLGWNYTRNPVRAQFVKVNI